MTSDRIYYLYFLNYNILQNPVVKLKILISQNKIGRSRNGTEIREERKICHSRNNYK